jgi:hypothetical protein
MLQAKAAEEKHNEADKLPSAAKETPDAGEKPAPVAENNQVNEDKAPSSEEKPAALAPTVAAPATKAVAVPTADGGSDEPRKPTVSVIPPTVENNKVTVPTTNVTAATEEGKPTATE